MHRALDISGLPQSLIDALEAMIRNYRERQTAPPGDRRAVGWARKDLPELPPEFSQDLPNDLLDLFEGKAA